MLDVLQDEEAMEEDAKAVLGNADDSNCSYHLGKYFCRESSPSHDKFTLGSI